MLILRPIVSVGFLVFRKNNLCLLSLICARTHTHTDINVFAQNRLTVANAAPSSKLYYLNTCFTESAVYSLTSGYNISNCNGREYRKMSHRTIISNFCLYWTLFHVQLTEHHEHYLHCFTESMIEATDVRDAIRLCDVLC